MTRDELLRAQSGQDSTTAAFRCVSPAALVFSRLLRHEPRLMHPKVASKELGVPREHVVAWIEELRRLTAEAR